MPVLPRLSRQGRTIILDCALVFVLMAALLWPLFRLGFLDNWSSIESTFIADGRFLKDHWPRPQWQPSWYGGTRFDYIYPPALRYGTAGVAKLLNVDTARGYHIYTAFFFAAGIAGVFLLARFGTGSVGAAWLAAAATALLSPCYLLLPHIRADGLHAAPWRLRVLTAYGEGPHVTALAVLGFALLAAFYALRDGKQAMIALAAALSALVVCNNFYGATSLAICFPLLLWAVWVTHRNSAALLRAAVIAALAYGLTAWWLTPSYLRVTMENLKLVSRPGELWSVIVAAVVAGAFIWLTNRFLGGRRDLAYTVFVFGACIFFSLNVLGNHYFNFRVMGEPGRLIPELDMFLILAAVEVLRRFWAGRVPLSPEWLKARPYIPRIAAALVVLLAFPSARHYLRHAWTMYKPDTEYHKRVEYRIPQWMARNMPEARALVTGSTRFWYNTWNDLAQAGGGSEQGILNQTMLGAMWQIVLGDQPEPGILWMQAMGVDAIVTHGPKSAELFHDVKHPQRFQGHLPVVFDDGQDNVIYRVPRRYPGLARVVDRQKLMARPAFHDGMEQVANLKPYVALVENGPGAPAAFRWEGTDAMRIHARAGAGEGVLVQVAYDPAWHAYSGGRALAVLKDPFGQMVIDTPPGEHDLRLVFETPLENRAGALFTVLSMLTVFGLVSLTAAGSRADPWAWAARRARAPAGAVGRGAFEFLKAMSGRRATAESLRRTIPAVYAVLIAAVNFQVCWGLFFRPFAAHMNSMHGEWIALARLGDWFSLKPLWWPFWGGGVPLEHTYSPLVPVSIAMVSSVLSLTHGQAVFLLAGLVNCALPVALYALAWRMTKAPGASFIAALAYSLLSPAALLVPDAAFNWNGLFNGRRHYLTVVWDDLPHVLALTLLPLFVLFLWSYLRSRRRVWAYASGLVLAAMMATSMFGWTIAAIAAACLVATEAGEWKRAVLSSAGIGLAAYLVVCPAFPPSLVAAIRQNSAFDGEMQWNLAAVIALAGVGGGAVLIAWAALRRSRPLTFALLFGWIMCAIPILYQHAHAHFLPQPGRYKFELEFAIALLLAFALAWVARRAPLAARIGGVLLVVAAVPQVKHLRVYVDGMLQARAIPDTVEYKSAKWAEQNLAGRRVMMGGSLGQWLNAFTDVPQLSAQPYTTTPNWIQQGALYNVYAGSGERDGEVSAMWLKAFGVQAVGVSGPNSPEAWRPFRNPRKFDGLLPVLWRQEDTTIYSIPQRSPALGHVVRRESLARLRYGNYVDVSEVARYVAALNDPALPDPQFTCATSERCSARAVLAADQVLSVQINYHSGWRARVNGQETPLYRDALGLMYVAPGLAGPVTIELTYTGSLEYWLCRIASPLTLVGLVFWAVRRRKKS